MSRKRILQGLAAISLLSVAGGTSIVMASTSTALAARTTELPIPVTSTTTTAPVATTTTTSPPVSTTTTTAPPATTTTTTTSRAASGTAATARTAGPGAVQLLPVPSGDADGKTREVWVYRPDVPDSADLPVVYLLHGYPGTDRDVDGIHLADLLDQQFAAGVVPFVVAVPNGQSDIHSDTEWADSVDGEVRIESFIVSTVIPAVEGANPRDAGHRAIAGFSMGGYGSANLAEHHPDLFGQLVSIAGYYDIDDLSGMGAANPGWEDAYSPDRHVASLAATRTLLIVDSGEKDPLIKGEGARFAALQRAAGQNPTFVVAPGNHNWQMVAGQVPTIVNFLDAGW